MSEPVTYYADLDTHAVQVDGHSSWKHKGNSVAMKKIVDLHYAKVRPGGCVEHNIKTCAAVARFLFHP